MHAYVYLCTSVVGTCMNISLFILHYRPCLNDFFTRLHPHPVCSHSCEYSVKCVGTSVPRDHLAVSYTHNYKCVLAATFEIVRVLTKHAYIVCMHIAQNLNVKYSIHYTWNSFCFFFLDQCPISCCACLYLVLFDPESQACMSNPPRFPIYTSLG